LAGPYDGHVDRLLSSRLQWDPRGDTLLSRVFPRNLLKK
jgi:nucleoid-associated protein YejK